MSPSVDPPPRKSTPSPPLPGSTTIRRGSCLCGAIQYELTGEPVTFRVCHCTNCRKASGSAFMSNAFFRPKNVRILQGEEALRKYHDANTKTGFALERQFCNECGGNLFLRPLREGGDVIIASAGAIDGDVNWLVKTEMFSEEKRFWVNGINMQKPKL